MFEFIATVFVCRDREECTKDSGLCDCVCKCYSIKCEII